MRAIADADILGEAVRARVLKFDRHSRVIVIIRRVDIAVSRPQSARIRRAASTGFPHSDFARPCLEARLERPNRRSPIGSRSAFTLVELLVVIGIIAVLIGILLPVLARAQSAARSVACLSNLRQMSQALVGYATENRGSMPYGWCWESPLPDQAGAPVTGNTNYSTVVSAIQNYIQPKRPNGMLAGSYGAGILYGNYSQVFRCPEVSSSDFPQPNTYVFHTVVFPERFYEIAGWDQFQSGLGAGVPARQAIVPAKLTQLFPDNALIWDTACWAAILKDDTYEPNFSFIDEGQLLYPQAPAQRYRRKGGDPFASDPYFGWGYPILTYSKKTFPAVNTDAAGADIQLGLFGAPRWRHENSKACNVAFADGSVRPLHWSPTKPHPGDSDYVDSEFLRKYILIKWPTSTP